MAGSSWKDMYEELRALRLQIARKNELPPWWCSNKLLQEISRRRPCSIQSFHLVPGIKPRHIKFAKTIVKFIKEYCDIHKLLFDVSPQRKNHNPEKQKATREQTRATIGSLVGVDMGLYHVLQNLRINLCHGYRARSRIFHNFAIRDMARRRPTTRENFLKVYGVGEKKYEQYGDLFLTTIEDHCRTHSVETDIEFKFDGDALQKG